MNSLRTDEPRTPLHNHCRVSGYRRLWFRLGRILTNLTYTRCAIVPRGRYWGPGAAAPVVIADRWLKCYTLCVPRRGGRVVEGGGLENR